MNKFVKTVCFIGGADISILKECPKDRNKFIAVGIGVFNTAALSMFTMGYAINAVLNDEDKSILTYLLILFFSIFWGFIIFGIDWGLISTIHKKKKYNLKSGFILVLTTIFRLLVAAIISFTVSRPLEVLVFKDHLPVAKREMQKDYREKLDAREDLKVEAVQKELDAEESDLEQWNLEKNETYSTDPILIRLNQEKLDLSNNYDGLSERYNRLNSSSDLKIEKAQSSINSIQYDINLIKGDKPQDSLSIQEQEQISSLRNSMNPFIATRNYERNEKGKRNSELKQLQKDISLKQVDINLRVNHIDSLNNIVSNQKIETINKLKTKKDTTELQAGIETAINKKTSNVLVENNLINNLIAVGYLERWNNDPNAEIGEKEIAKKVIFVRWLLIILILFIDIAPIVIKLLVKRGSYEELKESIEENSKIRFQADAIAFAKYYTIKADKIAKYETKIEELEYIKTVHEKFYSVIENLRLISFSRIDKIIKGFKGHDSERIKTILHEVQERMENQFHHTLKKMHSIFKDFIDNIKP